MKATFISREINTVSMTMEITAEEFENAINKVYKAKRNLFTVDGFRKGKAPRKLIESKYGKGVFYEDALSEALEIGRLAGAGRDVTDPEPVAPDSPLFKLPNVIVTPHYAPTTVESATRVSKIAAENINAVLAGQEPVGRIV